MLKVNKNISILHIHNIYGYNSIMLKYYLIFNINNINKKYICIFLII